MQEKYAEICSFICKICMSLYVAYIAFIRTPHFADGSDRPGYASMGLSLSSFSGRDCDCDRLTLEAIFAARVTSRVNKLYYRMDSANASAPRII